MNKNLIGAVKIKFYDQDTASVEYETNCNDKEKIEEDLMDLFTLFYAKILFNLGKSKTADSLIQYVQNAYNDVIKEDQLIRASILGSKLMLVQPINTTVIKNCVVDYFKNRDGLTAVSIKLDLIGEGYYAPTSAIILLQYIINFLQPKLLILFMYELRAMNDYYKRINYYTEEGLNGAPSYAYGLSLLHASKLNEIEKESK